jgi:hypothetical protein
LNPRYLETAPGAFAREVMNLEMVATQDKYKDMLTERRKLFNTIQVRSRDIMPRRAAHRRILTRAAIEWNRSMVMRRALSA